MLTLPATILLASAVHSAPEPDLALDPALFAAAPAPVQAERPGFSYTYIEGNYIWLDSDAADDNLDGFELTGSLELPLNFFVQGTGRTLSGDVDLDEFRLGAGWHFSLGDTIDAYGLVAYVDHNYNSGVSDADGVLADAGVRLALTPKIELLGYGEWADVEESDVGLGVGGRYYLTEALSLGLRVLLIDSGDEWAGGLRWAF